jgi:hypothetical protein
MSAGAYLGTGSRELPHCWRIIDGPRTSFRGRISIRRGATPGCAKAASRAASESRPRKFSTPTRPSMTPISAILLDELSRRHGTHYACWPRKDAGAP